MTDICGIPDFGQYFDRLEALLGRVEAVIVMSFIFALILVGLWILASMLHGRRRQG